MGASEPDQFVSANVLGLENIHRVFIDREGNVWVGSNVGFRKFPSQRNQFAGISLKVGEKTFDASGIDVSPQGWVLIAGYPGLGVLSDEDFFQVLNRADGFSDDVVDSLSVDSRDVSSCSFSVLQRPTARWNAAPKGMKGWTEISLLGQAYEFASREGEQG